MSVIYKSVYRLWDGGVAHYAAGIAQAEAKPRGKGMLCISNQSSELMHSNLYNSARLQQHIDLCTGP